MSHPLVQFRKLGTTGFDVSTISFGTWQLGGGRWAAGDLSESVSLLKAAAEQGINLFDAAVVYGQYMDERDCLQSRAQEALGTAFSDCRRKLFYCIKIGQYDEFSHRACFSPERLVGHIRHSLRRLKTDYIDIALIHAPSLNVVRRGAAIAVLRTLRELGMVRAVGYSFENEPRHVRAALQQDVDVIMLQYNLLETDCRDAIQRAGDRGIGILVGGPFKRGYLSGRFREIPDLPTSDNYWAWNLDHNPGKVTTVLSSVRTLLDECGSARELRRRALQFILAEQGTSSAVIGFREVHELEEDLDLAHQCASFKPF